ncbi:Sugar transporter [Coemansia sp. RSA 1939]|nr:Sugar transporter [Coemansia sp. RSA 1939]KAJ2599795.1 Sugar transporter [Coemansia sp. RSA 1804]KAJ2668068.1 Sugar transporter [Coemansia sp. RSA 1285]
MTLVSVAASGVTIAMFLSQLSVIPQLKQARRSKQAAAVPVLQFLMSFLSSVLWLKYGLLKRDGTIAAVNAAGVVVAFYILVQFWRYSSGEGARTRVEAKVLGTVVVGVVLVSYVDQSRDPAAIDVFSLACCAMSLLFLAAPLGQIGNVVARRDASVLLPGVAALAFANNVLWAVYGRIHADPYMTLPNGVGALFCLLQLGLIAYYGRAAAAASAASAGAMHDSPMDDAVAVAAGSGGGVAVAVESVPMAELAHRS